MKNLELRYPLKMLVLICFIVKLDKEIKLIVNFKFFFPFIESDRRFFIFSISCLEFAGNWKSEGIFYSLQCEKKRSDFMVCTNYFDIVLILVSRLHLR